MFSKIRSFFMDESGQAMTEYALIIGLIAVLLIAALGFFKDALMAQFNAITTKLGGATS